MSRVQDTEYEEIVVHGTESPVRVRLVPMEAQNGACAVFYSAHEYEAWFYDQIVSGADADWVCTLDPLDLERMAKAAIFVGYPWGVLMNPDLDFAELARTQRKAISQMPAQGFYLGLHSIESLIRLRRAIHDCNPLEAVCLLRCLHDYWFAGDYRVDVE
jgi:hypothetical protein